MHSECEWEKLGREDEVLEKLNLWSTMCITDKEDQSMTICLGKDQP